MMTNVMIAVRELVKHAVRMYMSGRVNNMEGNREKMMKR